MNMRLISSRICPYVQRVRILLAHADIKCDIEHINLKNPPDWFGDVSPLKKVPVLQVGGVAIHDSSIICDFLDEEFNLNLRPKENLLRAEMRSVIEYLGVCTQQFFSSLLSTEEDQFKSGLSKFSGLLHYTENYVSHNKDLHLNGFSMIDVAVAPLMVRIGYVEEIMGDQSIMSEESFPVLFLIKRKLLLNDAVTASMDHDSKDRFLEFLSNNKSILVGNLKLSLVAD